MRMNILLAALLASGGMLLNGAPISFTGNADTAAGIQPVVDSFRASFSGANNGGIPCSPSPCDTGRREINWDGVPSSSFDPFPGDFFNGDGSIAGRARGLSMSTPGTGLAVSDTSFGAPSGFQTFSPDKMFAAKGSNILDILFHVPGQPASSAGVVGMGIIFLDVEAANAVSMTFFDLATGQSLGTFYAPAGNNAGFSFLGVLFNAGEKVGRVRVTTGDGGIDTCSSECIAMDDFIYGEPQAESSAVPEPSTFSLLLGGAALLTFYRRRRCS
ncbi:MAG: PEP-CTERM sorting domain-containing protein [Bryobacterales bacterium]|nr:PEP-CTERM sorting domain-containing protein [Bryobacterales bacterium]